MPHIMISIEHQPKLRLVSQCSFHMVVLEAPIFDGRPDPWTLINWLDEMDQFFDQICLPDANKVRFARMKLISRARDL